MRRTHVRGHENILKRLLVHAGAFNLGLLMRKAFGRGTPRGLQGRPFDTPSLEIALGTLIAVLWALAARLSRVLQPTSRVLWLSTAVAPAY
jgi:transposase